MVPMPKCVLLLGPSASFSSGQGEMNRNEELTHLSLNCRGVI